MFDIDLERKPRNTARIRHLNDLFRTTLRGGRVMITEGVQNMEDSLRVRLINLVMAFDVFTEENDPHEEHDFGSVSLRGVKYFWKIDHYDSAMQYGSEDPADPLITTRVLTIMRADEY